MKQISKTHVTYVSFESLKAPRGVDSFVSARGKNPADILKEVSLVQQAASSSPSRRMFLAFHKIQVQLYN